MVGENKNQNRRLRKKEGSVIGLRSFFLDFTPLHIEHREVENCNSVGKLNRKDLKILNG